jgi:hypothetical protein
MLIINDACELARALDSPLAANIKALLTERAELIDLATFVIVSAGDRIEAVEAAAGLPIMTGLVDQCRYGEPGFMPAFEWVADHGGLYEAPFILSDDGAGVVLIVPDEHGADPDLLALLREYGESREADVKASNKPNKAATA